MEKIKAKDDKVLADVNPKMYITDKFGKAKAIEDKQFGKTKFVK